MTKEKLKAAILAMPEDEFEIGDLLERIRLIYKKDAEENAIATLKAGEASEKEQDSGTAFSIQ